eukprot:scaffold6.g2587.t1
MNASGPWYGNSRGHNVGVSFSWQRQNITGVAVNGSAATAVFAAHTGVRNGLWSLPGDPDREGYVDPTVPVELRLTAEDAQRSTLYQHGSSSTVQRSSGPPMEDELGLPKATMQKSIKGLLPKDMRVAGDAVDLITKCCNEFVQLVSTQARLSFPCGSGGAAAATAANQACEAEKRSTINPEHIVRALEELDFQTYVPGVQEAWDEFKQGEREHKRLATTKRSAAQDSGLTQAQLAELQQKMFAEARARTLSGPLPPLDGGGAAPPAAHEPAAEAAAPAAEEADAPPGGQ